jgi:TonB family protein
MPRVMLQVIVDGEGDIRCTRVIRGHPMLRRAALDAAEKWKFKPLVVEGKQNPMSVSSTYSFRGIRRNQASNALKKRGEPNKGMHPTRISVPFMQDLPLITLCPGG